MNHYECDNCGSHWCGGCASMGEVRAHLWQSDKDFIARCGKEDVPHTTSNQRAVKLVQMGFLSVTLRDRGLCLAPTDAGNTFTNG